MKIREGTEELFIQDKESVLSFLEEQGISDCVLTQLYQQMPFGLLEDAMFWIGEEPYEISHFLAKSETIGYDIINVNTNLGLCNSEEIAFAVVLGDDLLCIDKLNETVFLWKIQTGDGERINTECSVNMFIEKLTIGGTEDEED